MRTSAKAVLKPMGRTQRRILDSLSAGLSEQEIQRVLAAALSLLGRAGIDRLAGTLGPDTGTALRRALSPEPRAAAPLPGRAKVLQEWKRARGDWDRVIEEACGEEGKYVVQEHHWEEPYFDSGAVTRDLEPIAARMPDSFRACSTKASIGTLNSPMPSPGASRRSARLFPTGWAPSRTRASAWAPRRRTA